MMRQFLVDEPLFTTFDASFQYLKKVGGVARSFDNIKLQ